MSGLLDGKRGVIFGAMDSESIAWKAAEQIYQQGGRFVLSNTPMALRMGAVQELSQMTQAEVISADATSVSDLETLFEKSVDILGGGIDFILHSIGMSVNVRKKRAYTDLNYEWMQKGCDVSAVSFHKMMQTAKKVGVVNKGASIIALSYIAAQRTFGNYSDMADNKAYLESIARSFGYHWGRERGVRVNTISQSPTPTTAGKGIKGFDAFLDFAQTMSPLGNATAQECANYIVVLFSDFTKKVTMQNLYHDGGFSSVGVSEEMLDIWSKDRQK